MNRRQRLCFQCGAAMLLLTAAAHLAGHFSGGGPPADASEAELLRLMTTYTREMGHGPRSTMDLFSGFSLCFATLLALTGALDLLMLRRQATDAAFMRAATLLNALGAALLLALSIVYFFPPPTICLALVCGFFLAALPGRAA
jgi:hypothetical protein